MSPNGKRAMPSLTDLPAAAGAIPEWMKKMRDAAQACIGENDIKEIVENQVKRAKEGDQHAIKFVFDQVLGGAAFKGATFVQNNNTYGFDPEKPTPAKPGTVDRLTVMAARASRGLPLNGHHDAAIADDPDDLA